jgi:ubiquitin
MGVMGADQNATLNSIAKDVRSLNSKVDSISGAQNIQQADINILKEWKRSTEVAKEAVAEYKRQEQQDRMQNSKASAYNGFKDIVPYIIAVLAAVAALIYVHAAGGGK